MPWSILDAAPVAAGAFAPVNASYVVMGLNAVLTDERVLTAGAGITIVDGGAGGLVTVSASQDAGPWDTTVAVVHLDVAGNTVAIGAAVMAGAEKLRVVGAGRFEGALVATLGITGLSLDLSDPAAGTALFVESEDGGGAGVSGAATGRIRYDDGAAAWQISVQTGAYQDILTAAVGSTAFIQDGNSFGALATLGTNDANALAFETTGVERCRILAAANTLEGLGGFRIQGGAAAGNDLTFLGTGNVTAGNIIFRRFSGETARFVSTGPVLLFQTVTAIAPGNDHIQGDKNLNGTYNGMRARNTNAGTAALAEFIAQNSGSQSMQIGITSSGFTGGFGANQAFLQTTAGNGLKLITTTSSPIQFFTLNLFRLQILNSGVVQGNAGLTIEGGAAAGNDLTLRATASATDGSIFFFTDSTLEVMRIDAAGVRIEPDGVGGAAVAPLHALQSAVAGATPVAQFEQSDVSEEFIHYTGTAAAGVLTQSIVDEGDVTTATRAGFIKVFVEDLGNQITDQAYFMSLFTLA